MTQEKLKNLLMIYALCNLTPEEIAIVKEKK